MSKRIPYQAEYRTIDGYLYQTTVHDPTTGDVEWEPGKAPDEKAQEGTKARAGTPKLIPANTYDMLLETVRYLGRMRSALYKPDDERRVLGIYAQVERVEETAHEWAPPSDMPANVNVSEWVCGECGKAKEDHDRDVILGDKSYEWFHAMLARPVPLGREEKERGDTPLPFRSVLWGNSAALFQNQLRDRTDREYMQDTKPLED